jgi:hypothetical protein
MSSKGTSPPDVDPADDRPTLDRTALEGLGVPDDLIPAILGGSSCLSPAELHDRCTLLEDEERRRSLLAEMDDEEGRP